MNKQEITDAIHFMHNCDLSVFVDKDKAEETVDFICAILNQQLNNGWIPVDSRMPEVETTYQVTVNGEISQCLYCNRKWHSFVFGDWFEIEDGQVTAWQPLPEPFIQRTTNIP